MNFNDPSDIKKTTTAIASIQAEQDIKFMKECDLLCLPSRIKWDDCFMSIAFILSMRSLDPRTKCGAVAVSSENDILSVGYNSPPRGCDDTLIPTSSPEKYSYFAHAEENCIVNASRNGVSLKNSIIYVTSYPCEKCFRMMRNAGIIKIIYFSENKTNCVNQDTLNAISLMNVDKEGNIHISIEKYSGGGDHISETLGSVTKYINIKNDNRRK